MGLEHLITAERGNVQRLLGSTICERTLTSSLPGSGDKVRVRRYQEETDKFKRGILLKTKRRKVNVGMGGGEGERPNKLLQRKTGPGPGQERNAAIKTPVQPLEASENGLDRRRRYGITVKVLG